MALYDLVKDLPLEIESYELEGLQKPMTPERVRITTIFHLRGKGREGVGEDVTYDTEDQEAQLATGPHLPLAGSHTIDSFSQLIGELPLFPVEPQRDGSRLFRRWALESAALDLALRQADTSLVEVVGREPQPVEFVNSFRLDEPATMSKVQQRLALYPTLRFKLDATPSWNEALIAELAATGSVDSVDFKGHYRNTPVDQPPDALLYRRVVDGLPEVWLEDPNLTPETDEVLAPHRARVTWDAPIHSIDDIESLPFAPKMINVKPSRFGGLRPLFAAYDYCNERGIAMYGGGQFELGAGRGQIQYLASLFHPDTPNDTAPTGYNELEPGPGLPASPLRPIAGPLGFRWDA